MTAQPTRDQLRALALREDAKEHQPDSHGPDRCGDPECFTSCVVDGCEWPCETAWLLDQLDQADARIKAVQHLIDQADEMGEWAITCTRLQWAIDGSAPRPSA